MTVVAALAGLRAPADLPVPTRSPQEVKAAVREVLSRPEYRPPRRSLLQRAFEWVGDQLGRLFDALSGGGLASVVAWAVVAVAVALVVLLVTRATRGMTTGATRAVDRRAPRARTAAEWRALAASEERAGRWRAAARAHWRALVADLGERGLLDDVAGRTAGEHRVAVARDLPHAAAPFAAATDGFERAWYGNRATTAADVERLRAQVAEMLAAVGGGRVPPSAGRAGSG